MPTMTVYVPDKIYNKLPKQGKSAQVQDALTKHLFLNKSEWKARVLARARLEEGVGHDRLLEIAFEELNKVE